MFDGRSIKKEPNEAKNIHLHTPSPVSTSIMVFRLGKGSRTNRGSRRLLQYSDENLLANVRTLLQEQSTFHSANTLGRTSPVFLFVETKAH
ncbi:hypothetical protein AVEN_44241-1 [Araneus ventricosus]|uniref:Uncharacterized protein n=1 Tax=Araneus ventricosus TaxID=182803 RepID=A0A4Y2MJM5_ARAVE|nr:hypothetical protein AVEN_44241-1 [Araneus ventricosus]